MFTARVMTDWRMHKSSVMTYTKFKLFLELSSTMKPQKKLLVAGANFFVFQLSPLHIDMEELMKSSWNTGVPPALAHPNKVQSIGNNMMAEITNRSVF